MNLYKKLLARAEEGRPVRAGLIGAGKFGAMFLSQVPSTPGLSVTAIADLDPERARQACAAVGWPAELSQKVAFTDSGKALIARGDVDVVIESTGDPIAGIDHALSAIAAVKHIVMVNVEADCLAGPALAARARMAGSVYSLAYGDQPALVCEMVDWARACGFHVVAAGKGTKYLPQYHAVTPDEVWDHYGLSADEARAAGMNPQMFNSFLDGTKSAIEMAAIANATGLAPPADGLGFPPCGADELASVLRPRQQGGVLEGDGMVEVVSSLKHDGAPVAHDLRWGVYCVFRAPNAYAAACFREYGLRTDPSGQFAAMFKPYHLIGLELAVSVLNAAFRGEPTGAPDGFRADVAAVAKRDLKAGERLDGEGGYTVWGKLLPARRSLDIGALPIGFAHGVKLKRAVKAGEIVRRSDVALEETSPAFRVRREAEALA